MNNEDIEQTLKHLDEHGEIEKATLFFRIEDSKKTRASHNNIFKLRAYALGPTFV
jgi:predicted naringenin-chalcone synthase